jgi:hypothetical protein
MAARSYGLDVVWQFAAEEAVRAGSDYIEPAHLLMGLCSVEKLFSADLSAVELTPYSLASIRAEWQEVSALLLTAGISTSGLRRALRAELPQGANPPGEGRTVSRSDASRWAFTAAEGKADKAGSTLTGIIYLLDALLEDDDTAALLVPHCSDVVKLRSSVAITARRPLEAEPRIARKAATTAPLDRSQVNKMVKAALG